MSKKFIMSYMLIVCLSLVSHSFATEKPYQLLPIPSIHCAFDDALNKIPQEGFCEGTLVKVPDGYEYIQDLVAGDIVIDMDGNQTEVISVRSHSVHGYVDIFLPECVVSTGFDQLLYSSSQSCWIKCRNAYCKGRCIIKSTTLYALTTGTHTYCVTEHDMWVHNAEVLMEAIATVSFGHITTMDPITLLGGVTAILTAVVHNAQQTYLNSYQNKDGFVPEVIPDPVLLADRFYYETRKNDLECAKQELLTIKNDLEKMNALYAGRLTSQLLSYNTFPMKNVHMLSVACEKTLSETRKLHLRESRQADLALLENQIQKIHMLLALHVDYVISNAQKAQDAYNAIGTDIVKTADEWNNATIRTYEVDSRMYQHFLLHECLIDDLKHAVDELESVAHYYRDCTNVCIRQGTTIIAELERLEPLIKEKKEAIEKSEAMRRYNVAIVEDYFAKRNIAFVAIKSRVKNEFVKQEKARAEEAVKAAQLELVARNSAGGPNKNNKKNDDEENDTESKRVINKITKTEFFQKVKNEYEHWQNGIYKCKPRGKAIEGAEYLKWDYRHGDVEAYSKGQVHLGSINPHTLKLYKPPVIPRIML